MLNIIQQFNVYMFHYFAFSTFKLIQTNIGNTYASFNSQLSYIILNTLNKISS